MRKIFFTNIALLVALVTFDLLTKKVVTTFLLQDVKYNYGTFLGHFAASSAFYRVVTLATVGAFLNFIYLVLIYILPMHLIRFRLFITTFLAGIQGNVIDRMIDGKTIDFIPFSLFGFSSAYNFADIILTIGALGVIYIILFKDHEIWYPGNSRSRFLVMPKEQYRISLYFTLSATFICLILGTFIATFLHNHIPKYILETNNSGINFYVFLVLISVLYITSNFLFGLFISHKTFGPIYAFKQYYKGKLGEADENAKTEFRLRAGDNLKVLEDIARNIDSKLDQ
jgi:lipoprotein signal peptidase